MSEPRNDYGFPVPPSAQAQKCEEMIVRYMMGDPSIVLLPKGATKLERAQAYAAYVRARKFPPVVRITPKEST